MALAAFQLATAYRLITDPPDMVIYFEPTSAMPVAMAKAVRPDMRVFVHYHEYHAPSEFRGEGMRFTRVAHWIEKTFLLPKAVWISHTNAERLELFARDIPTANRARMHVLRNLPPASWSTDESSAWSDAAPPPLKLTYVGSLSLSDTYLESIVQWVHSSNGGVTLDIYAYNVDAATAEWLSDNTRDGVTYFPEGVEYDDIPALLRSYHTGLLLYRARTVNYQHNASNKLFEYLACSLDVLYPSRMLGVKPFARSDSSPRVIETDFESGVLPPIDYLSSRDGIPARPLTDFAESELSTLENAMIASLND